MPARSVALVVLVTAVWGVNFVVIHVGLEHFPPLLFAALRFVLVALAVPFVPKPQVPVRYVIYSHDHADHISGGQVFTDAVVVAHENAKAAIRNMGVEGLVNAEDLAAGFSESEARGTTAERAAAARGSHKAASGYAPP